MTGPAGGGAEDLVRRLAGGEALALSRAITALENDTAQAPAIVKALAGQLGNRDRPCLTVGVTGPPGVGKSTLVGRYIAALRRRGHKVGVLAVDPSSPLTGGAILGDRLRMTDHADDRDVFIRSIAARGHLGGLIPTIANVVDAMDAAGKDVVLLETVGAGQSEVEVAEVADVKLVVLAPGMGDEIQAIKAGILEIADILVVNKADLPQAERLVEQLKGMLALRRRQAADVPVLTTVATDGTATDGTGLEDLADAVDRVAANREGADDAGARRRRRTRRLLERAAAELLAARLAALPDGAVDDLCRAVEQGELGLADAAARLLED